MLVLKEKIMIWREGNEETYRTAVGVPVQTHDSLHMHAGVRTCAHTYFF